MENDFSKGIAFILEADTEYQFYDALIKHYCKKHPECQLDEKTDTANFERYYTLSGPFGKRIIRMNSVGTISQIHNSASWFNSVCLEKGQTFPWTVFLCYDTDAYHADITKFYQDDWKEFRNKLSKRRVKKVVDLAASADMEDVMLQDLHGISVFMERSSDLRPEDLPTGKKGAARMKRLFICQRQQGYTSKVYHKGERARALINCLDLDLIAASRILPLSEVEEECFQN